MADLSSSTFTGRLTADAVHKNLPTGTPLTTFSIAVNTGWGDYAKTLYVQVNLWGKGGVNVHPYLKKGTTVGVQGELEMQQWTSKQDGSEQKKLCLNTYAVTLLSQPKGAAIPQSEPEPSYADTSAGDIPF